MNELIPITMNENQEPIISGRVLYDQLGLDKSQWSRWYKLNIVDNEFFSENVDYQTLDIMSNGNQTKDFAIKLDMAKELCMLCRNDKGKQARQYFIQIEKDWNSPDKLMARALKIAETTIGQLRLETKVKDQQIAELKPKADYTDRILRSKGTVTVTSIAKDYGMSGSAFNKLLHELKVQFKQGNIWLLYKDHHDKGYTHSKSFDYEDSHGLPQTRMSTEWTQKGRLFLYELLKKNGFLPMIERDTDHNKKVLSKNKTART